MREKENTTMKNKKNTHQNKKPKASPKVTSPFIYGFHAVSTAWLNPKRRIEGLYITEDALKGFEKTFQKAEKNGIERPKPSKTDKKQLNKLLPTGAVHQGLAIAAAPADELFIQDLIIANKDKKDALFLILDQVTDPHNVGAILRSACAFSVDGLIMQRKHAPDLTGVLAKTACGAVEHVKVAHETNLSRAIKELQNADYFVYGLDERAKLNIGDLKKSGKTALVLGAEGPGLRRLVAETCDALVKLPMHGPMPSINVSNAAAVALYALKS